MSAYIRLKDKSQLDSIVNKFKKEYEDFFKDERVEQALEENDFDGLYNSWLVKTHLNPGLLTVLLLKCNINFLPYMEILVPYMFTTTSVDKLDFDYIYIPNNVLMLDEHCLYLHNVESVNRVLFEENKESLLRRHNFSEIGEFLEFITVHDVHSHFDADITVNTLRFGVKRGE